MNERAGTADAESLLSRIAESARILTASSKRARQTLSAGNLAAAIEVSEVLVRTIADLRHLEGEIASASRSWRDELDKKFSELESDLRSVCVSKGWKVDGSWPSLYVERAIPVEVVEDGKSVRVNGMKLAKPTIEEVLAAVEPIANSLVPKKFLPQAFIDQLAVAYDDAKAGTSQVAVFDVYRALVLRMQSAQFWRNARGDRFVGLTLEQLRARLSYSLEAGCLAARDGRTLRFVPPLDPKDGLFLYQPVERRFGYVGRIEFSRD